MLSLLVISLTFLAHLGAGAPAPDLLGLPIGPLLPPNATGPLAPVISLLANLGNGDPPKILWTPNPSPECAKEVGGNGGELQCCRVTIAGDLPIVVFLAEIYGYNLNPNDVNGVICDNEIDKCPGVRVCCQVSALNPLLSLYCADYNPKKKSIG